MRFDEHFAMRKLIGTKLEDYAVCGGINSFFMATIVAATVPNRWRWNAVRIY